MIDLECPAHVSNWTRDYCIGDIVLTDTSTIFMLYILFLALLLFRLYIGRDK